MDDSLPSDWRAKRADILERDGFTCGNCGKNALDTSAHLHVHHIVPRSRGGTHKPSNLKTLCERCHKAIHSSDSKAPTAGPTIDYDKMVEAWQTPPDMRSEAQEQYLTQVAEKLYEYAGGDDFQYYPSVRKTNNMPAPSDTNTSYSNRDAPSDLWNHLQAKWSAER